MAQLTGIGWLESLADLRKERVKAIRKLQELRGTKVFVFWNLDELARQDFFILADILEEEQPTSDIDLVVISPGGSGEAGFRIGHTFQGWCNRRETKFNVIVPLYAMSAATILALGAHSITMGLQSEIGPIDPQFRRRHPRTEQFRYVPAMAIIDGLKLVGEHIDKIPKMSAFFEQIIKSEQIGLEDLGLLERARESGKQYGETLLQGGMIKDQKKARAAVERLADYYKFHGHPIDAFEAEDVLGLTVAHSDGKEWSAIKSLRDQYQEFVGKPGLVPGAIVASAVETDKKRNWRYIPTGEEQPVQYRLLDPWPYLPNEAAAVSRAPHNRVGGGISPPPPTPPGMRVRTGRFTEDRQTRPRDP